MNDIATPAKKRLYWSTMPFMNYVFKNGDIAHFRHHRFATLADSEITELDAELKQGNTYIYAKDDVPYLTEEMEDPMKALKSKIIAEFLAEQAKHVQPDNDMGHSDNGPIKPQSTSAVAPVAAGGDATQLVALTKQLADKIKK